MATEKPKRKIIYIGDTAPDNSEYVAWIDTAERNVKIFENGQWVVQVSFADSVPGGVTDTFKVANKNLTFTEGILTSYD